nr:uncharacterized protein CTRU02_12312 [Colletotrichum truncatum]KAF6784851.1 hypothetical protein CTRU02_12312 [Colletotrichum truncatum]
MACPQQKNRADCGLQVIVNTAYLSAELPIPARVNTRLWRALIAAIVVFKKNVAANPEIEPQYQSQSPHEGSYMALDRCFRDFYLDADDMLLSVLPTVPHVEGSIKDEADADAHFKAVTAWHRETQRIFAQAKEKIASWSTEMRQVNGAKQIISILHRKCSSIVNEKDAKISMLELRIHNRQAAARRGHLRSSKVLDDFKEQLGKVEEMTKANRAICNIWSMMLAVLIKAEETLKTRIKMGGIS